MNRTALLPVVLGCCLLLAPNLPAQVYGTLPDHANQAVVAQTVDPEVLGTVIEPTQSAEILPSEACECEGSSELHIEFGVGLYFFQPSYRNNPGLTYSVGGQSVQEDIPHATNLSPVASYTRTTNGSGIRVRWFEYDHASIPVQFRHPGGGLNVAFPALPGLPPTSTSFAGQRIEMNSGLDLDSWDFDLINTTQIGSTQVVSGLGGAYKYLDQTFQGYIGIQGPPPPMSASPPPPDFILYSRTTTTGGGPTWTLQYTRPVANSGISVYVNGRYTLLVADTQQLSYKRTFVAGNVTDTQVRYAEEDRLLHLGEVEAGLKGERVVDNVRFFLQAGFAWQIWGGAGSATHLNGGNLYLHGGVIRGGVEF